MSTLALKFDSINEIVEIELDSTVNAEFFKNYLLGFNRPADQLFYKQSAEQVLKDFLNKAHQAKELFNFEWDLTNLTQDNFNLWHRDIETFDLSKYPPWSQEKGDFFIALHTALHASETSVKNNNSSFFSRTMIQIKWFSPSLPWPEIPNFKSSLDVTAGDIITDYPHVGKTPWLSYQQNDVTNLIQSCRLPDACPPGFLIWLTNHTITDTETKKKFQLEREQQLTIWYQQNIDQLEKLFTQDQMLTYDGEYCIGRLKNIDQLHLLQTFDLTSVSIV
jgi:hypothetical protein